MILILMRLRNQIIDRISRDCWVHIQNPSHLAFLPESQTIFDGSDDVPRRGSQMGDSYLVIIYNFLSFTKASYNL